MEHCTDGGCLRVQFTELATAAEEGLGGIDFEGSVMEVENMMKDAEGMVRRKRGLLLLAQVTL
jgi:hypothetical protein